MQVPEKELKKYVRSLNKGRKLLSAVQKKKHLSPDDCQKYWQQQAELLKEPMCAWYCAMVRDIIRKQEK